LWRSAGSGRLTPVGVRARDGVRFSRLHQQRCEGPPRPWSDRARGPVRARCAACT
jgi:hypothetical protein